MSLSGDKGVAQLKKSVKMGHPNDNLAKSKNRLMIFIKEKLRTSPQ